MFVTTDECKVYMVLCPVTAEAAGQCYSINQYSSSSVEAIGYCTQQFIVYSAAKLTRPEDTPAVVAK